MHGQHACAVLSNSLHRMSCHCEREMARHIKNWEELPKVSPAMSDGVEHILQLVRPDAEHTDRCRRDVMDAIRMIANLPTYVPPGTVKKQLQDVAVKLKAAHVSINKLPSAWRNLLLANELMRIRGKAEELAGVVSTKGRRAVTQADVQ